MTTRAGRLSRSAVAALSTGSPAETLLAVQLEQAGIPFEREVLIIPYRKHRADFLIDGNLVVEVDGGTWVAGRHIQGAGFEADTEKQALATILGYRYLRCTVGQVKDGTAFGWVREVIGQDRFWRNVRKGPGCWEWQGSRFASGYGQFYHGEKAWRTHRFVWTLYHGDPADLEVCHTCDNPPCVRPDHLFVGTHAENMADMVAKGRRPNQSGDKHPMAKLTWEQVRAIRESDVRTIVLAQLYGVSESAIRRARNARSWMDPGEAA